MSEFYDLMNQVIGFLRHKWSIWDFQFSFLEVWFYIAFVKLALSFVWQIFGQIPNGTNSSEQNYYGAGINGKAGSHHYGNKRG